MTTDKAKILIIEDDPLLVKMYQTKFTMDGYQVMTASDGQMGWDIIQKDPPQFVIMDVMMPKMSGIDLLEALRKDPRFVQMPVLMLSNLTHPEELKKAQALGVKEFLLKANFTPSQIVAKVKQYLQ